MGPQGVQMGGLYRGRGQLMEGFGGLARGSKWGSKWGVYRGRGVVNGGILGGTPQGPKWGVSGGLEAHIGVYDLYRPI